MYRNSEKFGAKISMLNFSWYTHTWWVSESHKIIENLPFLDTHLPGSVGFIREVEHFDHPGSVFYESHVSRVTNSPIHHGHLHK